MPDRIEKYQDQLVFWFKTPQAAQAWYETGARFLRPGEIKWGRCTVRYFNVEEALQTWQIASAAFTVVVPLVEINDVWDAREG